MMRLYPVTSHEALGGEARLIRLKAPQVAKDARPGQFVMLRVTHGQDPILARPFSIHRVDGDEISILYRIVGRGTKLLRLARPGHKKINLWGPLGSGFDLNVERPLLVAGGMGIAPLAFAAQVLLSQGKPVSGLYGAPSKDALVGGNFTVDGHGQIAGLDWQAVTEDGSVGMAGLITQPMMDHMEGKDCVLACGPLPMLKAVAGICAGQKIACQVSLEAPMACGLGACQGCAIPAAEGGYFRACQEGPVMDATQVDWSRM